MEAGLFNNVKKIGNYILKISKNKDMISRQIIREMSYGTEKEYAKNIHEVGIKTAKVYFSCGIFHYQISIQKYIAGQTVQDILNDVNISIEKKLKVFEKFIDIYKLSQSNSNLCLDWNMKNFIYKDSDIYYVDLVPCLYKNVIEKSTSKNLEQYKESYLNQNIQIAGILGYSTMSFIKYMKKEEAIHVYLKILNILKDKLDFSLNIEKNNLHHVYYYKLIQIEKYFHTDLTYENMKQKINNHSMTNTFKNKNEGRG